MCEKGGGGYKYRGRVMNINDQDGLQRYLKGVTSLWTTAILSTRNWTKDWLSFRERKEDMEREFLLLLFYGLFKILSEVVIWAKVALYNLQKLHYDMPKG